MRYAIISDIHGNLEALTAVLRVLHRLSPCEIVCLGDVVGYGANPNECVDMLRANCSLCVQGNHDRVAVGLKEPDDFSALGAIAIRWTRLKLSQESRHFLQNLPMTLQLDQQTLAVHAAVHPFPNESVRIRSEVDAMRSFQAMAALLPDIRLCFFGHTHRPIVYEHRGDGGVRVIEPRDIALDATARYLVNPGSVGQPRDGDPRASFILFDSDLRAVSFHRVPYDAGEAQRKIERAGLRQRRSLLGAIACWLGLKPSAPTGDGASVPIIRRTT
jgi:diadenosine tetraphosphatase ApaH/serine/threonine PP2A family protein phosphatase